MHMADALLSPAVGGFMYAVGMGAVAYAAYKVSKNELCDKKVPVMAVSGAFVFAAQMINFSIPGTGSSGHMGGGILLAGVLGGYPALLALAAVLVIQCLFFADGGLLALGANLFNMGVLPCLVAYPLLFKPIMKRGWSSRRLTVAAMLSTVAGLQLGSLGVVVETMASGVTELPFAVFAAWMQPIHLAIGIIEGGITAAILHFVYQANPELLQTALEEDTANRKTAGKKLVAAAAIVSVLVAGVLSLYASEKPDGLEWSMQYVAGTTELQAEGISYDLADSIQSKTAILPDYAFPAEPEKGTSFSGVVGTVMTCTLAGAVGIGISRRKKKTSL